MHLVTTNLPIGLQHCTLLRTRIYFNIVIFPKKNRTIFAVYEMVGSQADQTKAEELFNRLDLNCDGSISQDEFITIIKQDHNLLNVLQRVP